MVRSALTYDDIQLVPNYSVVRSRTDVDLTCQVSRNYSMPIPLVASCMDTVCGYDMMLAMAKIGGVGCLHRFNSIEEQASIMGMFNQMYPVSLGMGAIGVSERDKERAVVLVEAAADILVIDVAHGHHKNVIDMVKWCKKNLPEHVDIIAGNIATAQAAADLQAAGVDGLRVGIGGGSLCTTRVQTGFGVPNVTCLEEISRIAEVPIMADGGIRTSGDIAKALAVGADCVMLGSLLAGTQEAPGKIIEKKGSLYKRYRGSASLETKTAHGQAERNVEGESTTIPFKGGVKFILSGLIDGIRSACSYAGANSLDQFYPEYVRVTNAGLTEGKPHLL
jgi:IMP dehydrogenase